MKPRLIRPTPEADARITAAALADPDAQPITGNAGLKPVRGRPRQAVTRTMMSLRVDPDILEALRASGRGWQTRVNELLRKAVKAGKV
jgi:uncharacterized protein (DUF4415 family)